LTKILNEIEVGIPLLKEKAKIDVGVPVIEDKEEEVKADE